MKKLILFCAAALCISAQAWAQNGKLLSQKQVDLSKTPIWAKLTTNGTLKPAYAHLQKLDFYIIKYQSDGLEIPGIMVTPKKEGKYPTVIFNRGGNRTYGELSLGAMIMIGSKLASEGYVLIGSNYRKQDEFGGADLNDVLNLFYTLNEVPKADTARIGMIGWSRGGMMTYLSLKHSKRIKTAVVGNGASDLFAEATFRPMMEKRVFAECIPNYEENKEAELKKRSAVFWADELDKNSSLLILCSTKDKKVNPEQADKMAHALTAVDYDFELKKFETDHKFSDKLDVLNDTLIAWFSKRL